MTDASPTLGDRVQRAEESVFAGRERELRRLIDLVTDPRRLPHTVSLTGPPGIGKTAILEECARRVRSVDGGSAVLIDCHEFDGSVDGFRSALARRTAGWIGGGVEVPMLLGVDSYELLTVPRRRRLREEFLEQLTGPVLVVLADRKGPADMLSQRAGWRACMETMSLGPLAEVEARRLLARRGLSDGVAVADALRLAAGHPLVLAVAADVALRCGTRPLPAWLIAETVTRMLHLRLRREARDPRLADLLEASSLMPVVDHDLLSEMLELDLSNLEAAYADLSVVEAVSDGYAIRQPWRHLLSTDLLRRRPRRHAQLVARAHAHRRLISSRPSPSFSSARPLRVVGTPGWALDLDECGDQESTRNAGPAIADGAARERVKLALEALDHPEALAERWPLDDLGVDGGVEAVGPHLQRRLLEIIRTLAASRSPRVSQAGRVLHCYYVVRTGSLEAVAERLCVSRATLFRRLSLGLTLVYERLADGDLAGVACA
jgi:hypothetical protein